MPQVEQLQVVYWGSLRADPVDLAVDGINVATGPNGSGKTTSLDALKLILGISDLGRRPAEYIYDGGGEASQRAERALVKAIFANPLRPGRAGRVFADAGRGCELSAHVTAVCEVTRDNRRRFALLPGPVIWGIDGRDVEHDVHAMRSRIPGSQWMTARTWDELLARAGCRERCAV
jgi:energy-coupling factor transporter ATP-binding protein EcfA2